MQHGLGQIDPDRRDHRGNPCACASARQGPYQTAPQGRTIPLPENPPEAPSDEPDAAAAALTPLQQAIRVELERLVAGGEEEPDLTRLTRLTRELCLPQRRAG